MDSSSPPRGQTLWHQTLGTIMLSTRIATNPMPVVAAAHVNGSRQTAKKPLKMQSGSSQMSSG